MLCSIQAEADFTLYRRRAQSNRLSPVTFDLVFCLLSFLMPPAPCTMYHGHKTPFINLILAANYDHSYRREV